jgi:hypothetical protein
MFKQPILVEHCVQSNKVEYHVEINERINFSIHDDMYNKQIQDVSIILCFCHERLCSLKQIKYFSMKLSKQLSI